MSSLDWKRGNLLVKKKRRIMPADHISMADRIGLVNIDIYMLWDVFMTDPRFAHYTSTVPRAREILACLLD
jgi:hypothetical protein